MPVYQVRDRAGSLRAYHVRVDRPDGSKAISWRRADGTSGLNGTSPDSLPLYGADRLDGWPADGTVVVVEGEKCADALVGRDIPAVGTYGTSATPEAEVLADLAGRHVVLWPDADEVGRRHMAEVAQGLVGVAATIRVATWADAPDKGDAADLIATGRDPLDVIDAAEPYVATPTVESVPSLVRAWPAPLPAEAYHGLAGSFVRVVEPRSEADPAALLVSFLAAAGALAGPATVALAGEDAHPGRLDVLVVGDTGKGRKGTSLAPVRKVLRLADPVLAIAGGLSSGEGLIYHVRDAVERVEQVGKGADRHPETIVVDEGVDDKRLLVVESEFASVVRAQQREGSRLSAVIRQAWDWGDLQTLTKNSPLRATGAHVAIVGHVTREELLRYLDRTELASGLVNRFIVIAARRQRELPDGEGAPDVELARIASDLRRVQEWAQEPRVLKRDEAATRIWRGVYHALSAGRPGLLGAATNRAEAQVLRLSVVYAILDMSTDIRAEHLLAALAVWEYAAASAGWVFGDATGDDIADAIVAAARARGGITRTDIRDLFARNVSRSRTEQALTALMDAGRITCSVDKDTGGRPRETYRVAA